MASLLLEAGTEQSYFRYHHHHHHMFLSEIYQKFQIERINAEIDIFINLFNIKLNHSWFGNKDSHFNMA